MSSICISSVNDIPRIEMNDKIQSNLFYAIAIVIGGIHLKKNATLCAKGNVACESNYILRIPHASGCF
jgi:hypothetical protein